MKPPPSFDEGRARVQLRQFAWTMRQDGSLHGPASKRLYKGRIPATVTIGGTVRFARIRLQAELASAMVSPGTSTSILPPSAKVLLPLIAEAVDYARQPQPQPPEHPEEGQR